MQVNHVYYISEKKNSCECFHDKLYRLCYISISYLYHNRHTISFQKSKIHFKNKSMTTYCCCSNMWKTKKTHPISCMILFLQISFNSIWIMFDLVELFTMWKVHSRCLKKTTVYYSDSIINCMNERDFSGDSKGFPRNWFVWKVNRKNTLQTVPF